MTPTQKKAKIIRVMNSCVSRDQANMAYAYCVRLAGKDKYLVPYSFERFTETASRVRGLDVQR